jgi:hypothetical protein
VGTGLFTGVYEGAAKEGVFDTSDETRVPIHESSIIGFVCIYTYLYGTTGSAFCTTYEANVSKNQNC